MGARWSVRTAGHRESAQLRLLQDDTGDAFCPMGHLALFAAVRGDRGTRRRLGAALVWRIRQDFNPHQVLATRYKLQFPARKPVYVEQVSQDIDQHWTIQRLRLI